VERGEFELPVPLSKLSDNSLMLSFATSRRVAKRSHPGHAIRHLITLGAPLMMSRGALPESVRITALHSRSDRIVRHPGALARDPGARNIEVRGSHVGLIGNPEVYRSLGSLLPPRRVT